MKFDVRNAVEEEITEIVFSEGCACREACFIDRNAGEIFINDEEGDEFLSIASKEHALNLIKALNKAIELGWVK